MWKKLSLGFICSLFVMMLGSVVAQADDTEIFFAKVKGKREVNPNVLFVLDNSGSMAFDCPVGGDQCTECTWTWSTGNGPVKLKKLGCLLFALGEPPFSPIAANEPNRMSEMKLAMETMLDDVKETNVGIMKFSHEGIKQIHDIVPIFTENQDNTRDSLKDPLGDDMYPWGGTPLVESLIEAAKVIRGPQAMGGTVGEGGVTTECQSNHIVLLSDGEAAGGRNDPAALNLMANGWSAAERPTSCVVSGLDGDETCGRELATWMANADHNLNIPNTPKPEDDDDGRQNITLHTIGFGGLQSQFLKDLAKNGGGLYQEATTADELLKVFRAILKEAKDVDTSLVAPAASIDQFNRLSNSANLYYALFNPKSTSTWNGNLKYYKLELDDSTGELIVVGNGGAAVDPVTGNFADSSSDFWSDTNNDGATIERGGIANKLSDDRNLYTYLGDVGHGSAAAPVDLRSDITHEFRHSRSIVPHLGTLPEGVNAQTLINWARGEDTKADPPGGNRFHIGDPLHSTPITVNYGQPPAPGETPTNDEVIFFTTNEGFLHAIQAKNGNSNGGEELYGFIPKELLENLTDFYNDDKVTDHPYGLDGHITKKHFDTNNNRIIDDNEALMLYVGMRRGGRNYYAWDVSNADLENASADPISNLWSNGHIIGGLPGTDFENLGYTWSTMIRTQISWNCTYQSLPEGCDTRDVLVFSGGYDGSYDNDSQTFYSSNTVAGDAVYIVDALTGALLWSVGNEGDGNTLELPMYNSIPSTPSVVDIDGDGDMDMLFAIDISGQVFRVDFDQTHSGFDTGYATGGMIADLTSPDARRFYNGTDISLQQGRDGSAYLAIAVGSGYRAGPRVLENWENRFYVIIDENITQPTDSDGAVNYSYVMDGASNLSVITESDLHIYSPDNPFVRGAVDSEEEGAPNGEHGFYRSFSQADGEKILQDSITFNGRVLVLSYSPSNGASGSGASACGTVDIGSGTLYLFDILTGELILSEKTSDGIPPNAVVIIPPADEGDEGDGGDVIVCIGTNCSNEIWNIDGNGNVLSPGVADKTYWREL